MNLRCAPCVRLAVLLFAGTALLEAAYTAGGTAYTKRYETKLLAEPRPLAAVAAKLGFGRKLAVDEVQGSWLRVRDGGAAGWVFAGNVSETKPADHKGLDAVPLAASETTATAAARPLTPAAEEYAASKNLTNARDDLNWLLQQAAAVSSDDVATYLETQKKGEYQ